MSTESLRRRPLLNPLFVAVPVTASLCAQLTSAVAKSASTGHLPCPSSASHMHTGSPLYWDTVAGTALDQCLEAGVRWLLAPGRVQAELWGCRQYPDGGYAAPQALVRSRSVSLATITRMSGTGPTFVFDAQPDWVDSEGEPFALAVHRRLRALGARAPPLEVKSPHPKWESTGRTPEGRCFRDHNSPQRGDTG